MNHYVYYTYEEWGRGYIGARSCGCPVEEDFFYLGSFLDKTFRPTGKIILLVTDTRAEANEAEILLHEFFKVDINPHFANQVRQTSTKFHRSGPHSQDTIVKMRTNRRGKGLGPSPHPREHLKAIGRTGGLKGSRNQSTKDKRKGGVTARENKLGFFALSPEENLAKSKKAAQTTNSLRFRCTVTGKVSTPGGLSRWQTARNIDPSYREQVYPEREGV